jgi:hypothetical protein
MQQSLSSRGLSHRCVKKLFYRPAVEVLPLLGVMTKHDKNTVVLKLLQSAKALQRCLPITDERRIWQHHFFKGLAQVTGVGRKNNLAVRELHLERLVTWSMAVRWNEDDAPIAEEIMLPIDREPVMTEIILADQVTILFDGFRRCCRYPLSFLKNQSSVIDQFITAAMIKMQV